MTTKTLSVVAVYVITAWLIVTAGMFSVVGVDMVRHNRKISGSAFLVMSVLGLWTGATVLIGLLQH